MTVESTLYEEENIIIHNFRSPYHIKSDIPATMETNAARLEATPGKKLYVIPQLLEVEHNFSDVVELLSILGRGHVGWSITDPRTEVVVVATEEMMKHAAEWLQQEQYGGATVDMFLSVDEALAEVRRRIAQA